MEDLGQDIKPNDIYFQSKRKYISSNDDSTVKVNNAAFGEIVSVSSTERISSKSRGVCLPAAIADGLARHHAHEQLIYKRKLKRLKKFIRNIVLENGALCDTVSSVQDELAFAIEERQYLLRRVMQIQLTTDQSLQDLKSMQEYEEDEKPFTKKLNEEKISLGSHSNKSVVMKKRHALSNHEEKLFEGGRSTPRWKKSSKVKRKCPPIPLDASGRPIFPLTLGRLTIHSLGDIMLDREGYHNELMIFPVGFCSSRMYASLRNPHQQTLYTCTIKEGVNGPGFDIVCDEDEVAFFGNSPSDCHSQILKKVNMVLGIDLLPTSVDTTESDARGLRFFGLSHPSVQNMIQACSGARKCSKYKWIQFEVCKSEEEAEGVSEPEREASICHQTLLRNIRFASNHM